MTDTHVHPMLDLTLIRKALDGDHEAQARAREHLDSVVQWKPGDLVEYDVGTREKPRYVKGVIVAWMMHQPSYICGTGDDRNKAGGKGGKLLAVHGHHVRARRGDDGGVIVHRDKEEAH